MKKRITDVAAGPAFVFAGVPHQARKRAVLRAELDCEDKVEWWVVAWRYDYDDGAGNHAGTRYDDQRRLRPEYFKDAHADWLIRCQELHQKLGIYLAGIDVGWSKLEEEVEP